MKPRFPTTVADTNANANAMVEKAAGTVTQNGLTLRSLTSELLSDEGDEGREPGEIIESEVQGTPNRKQYGPLL